MLRLVPQDPLAQLDSLAQLVVQLVPLAHRQSANIIHNHTRHKPLIHSIRLRRPKQALNSQLLLTLTLHRTLIKAAHMPAMRQGTTIFRPHQFTRIMSMDKLLTISIRGALSQPTLQAKSAQLQRHSHKMSIKLTY